MASKALNLPKSSAVKPLRTENGNGAEENGADDTIRNLAYRKWEAAGKPDGDGLDFWLEAERELNES